MTAIGVAVLWTYRDALRPIAATVPAHVLHVIETDALAG